MPRHLDVRALIALVRPRQYAKNLIVLFPVFFAGKLFTPEAFFPSVLAFIAFSFISSSAYALNDIVDVEQDRCHPQKKYRPLAAGQVSVAQAGMLAALMLILGLAGVLMLPGWGALGVVAVYIALNVAYSLRLKHLAIVDVGCISAGFVLRVFLGAQATGVEVSHWLVLMAVLLSMFLALGKRWDDLCLIETAVSGPLRFSLQGYNKEFVANAMQLMAAVNMVCYVMYTTSIEVAEQYRADSLYLTSFWVLFGLLRYYQLVFVYQRSSSPTTILYTDRVIQLILAGWVAHFVVYIYL